MAGQLLPCFGLTPNISRVDFHIYLSFFVLLEGSKPVELSLYWLDSALQLYSPLLLEQRTTVSIFILVWVSAISIHPYYQQLVKKLALDRWMNRSTGERYRQTDGWTGILYRQTDPMQLYHNTSHVSGRDCQTEVPRCIYTVFRRINASTWINATPPPNFWLWLAISQELLNRSESYFYHLKLGYSGVHTACFIEIR